MVFDQSDPVRFVKVICKDCGEENILFTRATTRVYCPRCHAHQTLPKGGKCKLINCTKKEDLK